MTLSKQTFRRGHGFASLFPSMDMKSFPLGSKCAAFGPYDSYIILGSHFQPRSFCFMLFTVGDGWGPTLWSLFSL